MRMLFTIAARVACDIRLAAFRFNELASFSALANTAIGIANIPRLSRGFGK